MTGELPVQRYLLALVSVEAKDGTLYDAGADICYTITRSLTIRITSIVTHNPKHGVHRQRYTSNVWPQARKAVISSLHS